MRVIGLTGGIATGKSTVANRVRTHGIPVLDADEVARRVVAPGQPALQALVDALGPDILSDAGALDRFIRRGYRPLINLALEWRYLTAAVAVATLIVTGSSAPTASETASTVASCTNAM